MTTPSDNTLVEAVARDILNGPVPSSEEQAAEISLQAIRTHVGLTIEVLEMIRRGEAIVIATEHLGLALSKHSRIVYSGRSFVVGDVQLKTPIERREG